MSLFRRKATAFFEAWRTDPKGRALIVSGARQVGKSTLALAYAREHFPTVAAIDLLEDADARRSLSEATSAEDLALRISLAAGVRLVPGQTAIIIDEVQEAPNVLTFIKYLVQKGDYRYILTGSLLGVTLENIDSLPVGYASLATMYPMDFEEFCWAHEIPGEALDLVRASIAASTPVPDFLHTRLAGLFHRYLLVGGMPAAVSAFTDTGSIDAVRDVHQGLHSLYRADISKRAPQELRLLLRDIYDLIPAELSRQNRRFRLASLKDVQRFSQAQSHFLWLTAAGVSLPCYNVSAPVAPLLANEKRNLFRLFYLDVGMLTSSYPKRSAIGILDGTPSMNMGGVYEAFVAQELTAHRYPLRYFTSKSIGELDFLVEDALGNIDAIEIKSGTGFRRHCAIDKALTQAAWQIRDGLVFAETNVEPAERVAYLPIYAVGLRYADRLES